MKKLFVSVCSVLFAAAAALAVPSAQEKVLGEQVKIETGLLGYTAKGLPSGMKYDKKTGLVTGAGKRIGEYDVTFSLKNAATETLKIVIRAEEIALDAESIATAALGVGTYGVVEIRAEAPVTGVKAISVSGAPKGMKFDKKTSSLVGTPSKSGEFTMKVTVTAVGGTKKAFSVPVSVTALPDVALGTLDGIVGRTVFDMFVGCGTISIKAAETGKLTVKVVTASGTLSLSAPGWATFADGVYAQEWTTKKGEKLTLAFDTNAAWDASQVVGQLVSGEKTYDVSAQRKAFVLTWYFTATGDEASGWTLGYAADAKSAALTLKVKADGSTSIAGKLGAVKVSASGAVDIGGLKDGALLADFVPKVSVKVGKKTVKKSLYIRTNFWFDRSPDHEDGVGSATFVD